MKKNDGQLIYLRKLKVGDAPLFHNWFSDYEVIRYSLSRWLKRHTLKQIEEWLTDTIKDKKTANFGIVEKKSGKLIGYAGISGISKSSNSGEYFILIGDKSCWGKGYGTEVTRLVLDYGFAVLKLHRISLTVSEPNIGAVKSYLKAGFIKEGILRDASFRDGNYHNKIQMSILEDELRK